MRPKHLPGRHNQESHGNDVGGGRLSRFDGEPFGGIAVVSRSMSLSGGELDLGVSSDGLHLVLQNNDGGENRSGAFDADGAQQLADLLDRVRDAGALDESESGVLGSAATSASGGRPTGYAQISREGDAVELELLETTERLRLTPREVARVSDAVQRYSAARRLDTNYGPVDVWITDGDKFGFRTRGEDGDPVEVAFDARSMAAIEKARDTVWEGYDEDDPTDDGEDVTVRHVQTNAGRVRVERFGEPETFDRIEITPADGGDWALVVDYDEQDKVFDAISNAADIAEYLGFYDYGTRAPITKRRAGMATKSVRGFQIKDAEQGTVSAVFATFNVIDSDGDVTVPGAFEDGAQMAISAYGHTSWQGALPVGIAKIRTTANEAILDGQFFMDTEHGRDTFRTVKRLHDAGLGEWSYGYDVVKHTYGEHSGRKARFLQKLLVHEASPVLVGAGVNTRTLAAKSGSTRPSGRSSVTALKSIRPHETDVVNRRWDPAAELAALAEASLTDLRSMAAYVNADADPETKAAYGMLHHHGPNGPANARACFLDIARLNGAAGGTQLGEAERKAVYDHLAAHLRDADREPPELRAAGGVKDDGRGPFGAYLDDVVTSLVGVSDALASTDRAVALRATKGRSISKHGIEYLGWLDEELLALRVKLRSLIDSPDDDAAREYMRFVALQQRLGEPA